MRDGSLLVQALLFGNTEGLPEETLFLYSRTGLVHLFSASGFHLFAARAVADALAWPLLRIVPEGRTRQLARFLARTILMTYFAIATGASSPMVRALAFSVLSAGAILLEVETSQAWLFTLSLLASAVLGKGSTLSFLLSALGMAGVLYVRPRNALALALGPWLFTMPLTVWCFGLFPFLAPLWNLTFGLAVSWLVLPLAILALTGRSLGLPVDKLDAIAAELMERLHEALRVSADALGGAFWVRPGPWALLAGTLLLAGALRRARPRFATAMAAAGLALSLTFPQPAFTALDVGQGDALLLRTRHGIALVDAGTSYLSGGAPVSRALESMGVGEVSDVLLTHFDLDHRGGLASLLVRHPVSGALWFRESELGAKNAAAVLLAAERAGVPVRFLEGENAPPGLRCWLAPFPTGNDSSPLCRAELTAGASALLTGDMSERAESWFLAHLQPFPEASLLKVAHHGSRTSSSAAFLAATHAREAVVSVGTRNRYGHPTAEALARLDDAGLRVRRTDREGNVNYYFWGAWISALFTEDGMRPAMGAAALASDAEPTTSRLNPGMPATASRL